MNTDPTSSVLTSTAPDMHFELPDGNKISVAPVTFQQARLALQTYPPPGTKETSLARIERLMAELSILLGPDHAGVIGSIPPLDGQDIVARIWSSACGHEPEEAAWPPLRLTPRVGHAPLRPAAYLLTALARLNAGLSKRFPLLAGQIDSLPLAGAFRASTQLRPEFSARN